MKKLTVFLPFLAIAFFVVSACKKPEDPKGVVKVVNQKEEIVWGANVLLHAYDVAYPSKPGDSLVVRSGTTDSNGEFHFEEANPCVLTIEAWALEVFTDSLTGSTYKDTVFGTASIRLEVDETSRQTVILRP